MPARFSVAVESRFVGKDKFGTHCMIVTFLAMAAPHPVGGAVAIFELANGLARCGHEVHLVHLDYLGQSVQSRDDLDWFAFDNRVIHHFPRSYSEESLPEADFVVCCDDRVPRTRGLPLSIMQGVGGVPELLESTVVSERCPKLCVSRYVVEHLAGRGVPPEQLVHLPNGIDHDIFHVRTPPETRPMQVAMRFHNHMQKDMIGGLKALRIVQQEIPECDVVLFGREPGRLVPPEFTFVPSQTQPALANGVYNRSRVFVCSSTSEGFGLPSVEAMACGSALVTTDNGGSREFAINRETALVCQPSDPEALAALVVSLLRDDDERIRLAYAGTDYVRRFDWDRSAQILVDFLGTYAGDPARFQTAGPPRPVVTPEITELRFERTRLSKKRLMGYLSLEEYTKEFDELTIRIDSLVDAAQRERQLFEAELPRLRARASQTTDGA